MKPAGQEQDSSLSVDLLDKRGHRIRLTRAFFIGRAFARTGAPEPWVAFREIDTGLLRVVHRELVVRFRPGTSVRLRRAILEKHGLVVLRTNAFVADQVIVYSGRSGEALVGTSNELTGLEEVVMATPNFLSQYRRQAAPEILPREWHLEDINVARAWRITTGRPEIVVAVLDDGVDMDHPNLRPNLCAALGRDFFLPDGDPDHFNPRPKRFQFPFDQMKGNDIHGTSCAGLVAAGGLAGGAVGVAPDCLILPVKIFHADDLAADERVADAIRYAARHADILSCSWTCGASPDIRLALEDAGQGRGGRGAAVFCAAGNDAGGPVCFPAREPGAIAVGASTDQARRAGFSNVGPELSVVAPSSGGLRGIFTTMVSGPHRSLDGPHTDKFGGTSAATALAAGTAALVLSANPAFNREELKDLLESTADKIAGSYDARGHNDEMGRGRVNAGKAVLRATE